MLATRPPTIRMIGAATEAGGSQPGCRMGPAALRTAGIVKILSGLGYQIVDEGDLVPPRGEGTSLQQSVKYPRLKNLAEAVAWTELLQKRAYEVGMTTDFPLFLGGDHALALGTVPGLARGCRSQAAAAVCPVARCPYRLPSVGYDDDGESPWHAGGLLYGSPEFCRNFS